MLRCCLAWRCRTRSMAFRESVVMDKLIFKGDFHSGAVFSSDNVYRYLLRRVWGDATIVNWIMLNPSTADHQVEDPTIRRCIRYSRDWGYGGIVVTNLFAYRATSPKELRDRQVSPVGQANDIAIRQVVRAADLIVCGWGRDGSLYERDRHVFNLLPLGRRTVKCLGVTRDGSPRHPLYLPKKTELCDYLGRP